MNHVYVYYVAMTAEKKRNSGTGKQKDPSIANKSISPTSVMPASAQAYGDTYGQPA